MLLRHLVLACCLLFCAFNAAGEWYNDYQQGLDWIKKGNWAEAIKHLQNAIRQKDQEAGILNFYEKTYGDYYPHYYLAMAHFYSEQYQEAVAEFDKSLGFGEIQKNPELHQKLKDLRSLAGAQLAAKDFPKSTGSAASVSAPVVKTPEDQQQQPAPQTSADGAASGEQDGSTKDRTAETLKSRLRAWMRVGAKTYFEGNFDDAIAMFSQLLRQDPENASAQFLLGCSYASKYLLSGSQDRRLFEKASVAFQNAKRIDPNYSVTENPFISPAILQIYRQS
ncbi:MAG TPA: tetratricopeptide repeat protein [Acidobacteriota bacterium]